MIREMQKDKSKTRAKKWVSHKRLNNKLLNIETPLIKVHLKIVPNVRRNIYTVSHLTWLTGATLTYHMKWDFWNLLQEGFCVLKSSSKNCRNISVLCKRPNLVKLFFQC